MRAGLDLAQTDPAEINLAEVQRNIDRAHHLGAGAGVEAGGELEFPWRDFGEFFEERVHEGGEKSYLAFYDGAGSRVEYSYRQFGDAVNRLAGYLSEELGIHRGGRVATVMHNHSDTVLIYFACWRIGACVVPINAEESPERKTFILANAEVEAVFCRSEYLDEAAGLVRQVPSARHLIQVGGDGGRGYPLLEDELEAMSAPAGEKGASPGDWRGSLEDDALIVYTSGTTGAPKGVLLSQYNLLVDAHGISRWFRFTREDRLMCVLPIHHVNGTVVTLVTPFYAGGNTVLNRRFSSERFWSRICAERVNCVSVVPTLLEFLLEADEDISKYDLSCLRGLICGAGPLLVETAVNFERRFGIPIWHGYGLSETTCYSCFLPVDLAADERRRWLSEYGFPSIGLPIGTNEMCILGPDGDELPEMERGEICIRGLNVMKGYYRRPDANREAFRHGWFQSGDEGFFKRDEEGRPFFFITGRIKELIIRGGVNISPLEIDDVLKVHPKVKFGMAVPFDNKYYGDEIAAYVVPREGAEIDSEEILEHCRRHLSFAKQPKVVVFGTEVPYTSTGKPKRLELKRQLQERFLPYRDVQFRKAE